MSEEILRPSDEVGAGVAAELDLPDGSPTGVVILAHGAGGNRTAVPLLALSEALTAAGMAVARIDLPYRQLRPKGPPSAARSNRDREGIRAALDVVSARLPGIPAAIGGHSYGGRQASMVAAEDPSGISALVLTSYPLHPPGKPERLRIEHLPQLTVPTVIAQGERDPFGSPTEIEQYFAVVSAPVRILPIAKVGHDLAPRRSGFAAAVAQAVRPLLASS